MTIDLTQIVIYVIGLVFALISAFLIPYIKSKLSAEQFKKLQNYAKVAVEAAEMIYNTINAPSYMTGQIITMDGGFI